jgi:hypothetical protein
MAEKKRAGGGNLSFIGRHGAYVKDPEWGRKSVPAATILSAIESLNIVQKSK